MATIERNAAGYWRVIMGDRIVLDDESYTVASNVAHALNTGARGTSECDEVAREIIAHA